MTKNNIDRLVNIYLDAISSISNDAGWRGDSMLARCQEFQGFVPPPTRNDKSNAAMINHIRYLKKPHACAELICGIIKQLLGTYETSNKIQALLSRHYYKGLIPGSDYKFSDRDRMLRIGRAPLVSGEDCAAQIWQSAEKRFKADIEDAYALLSEVLDRESL